MGLPVRSEDSRAAVVLGVPCAGGSGGAQPVPSGKGPLCHTTNRKGLALSCGLEASGGPALWGASEVIGPQETVVWLESWWYGPLLGWALGGKLLVGLRWRLFLTPPPSVIQGRGCLRLHLGHPLKRAGATLSHILPWSTDHLGQGPTWNKWLGPARGLLERGAICRQVQESITPRDPHLPSFPTVDPWP